MPKEKKIKIIVAVLIVLLAGCGIWGCIWYNSQKEWIILNYGKKDILYFEEGIGQGNTCFVLNPVKYSRSYGVLKSEYIYFTQCKYKENGYYGPYGNATEIDYVKVKFYDVSTRKKIGEVDLTEIIRGYLEQGFEWDKQTCFVYVVNDREAYAELHVVKYDRNTSPSQEILTLCINLNTREVEEYDFEREHSLNSRYANAIKRPEALVEKERVYNFSMGILEDEIGLLEENGFTEEESGNFWVRAIDETSIYIHLEAGMLPEENERLYKEFPGLKGYEGKAADDVYICLNGYLTAEEVLSMVLEEGQEISFEGCVLPAESSVDGKEHEINSFEDYYQWNKWDK